MEPSSKIRKEPVQARSKARVEQILKVAEGLIAQHGSDGLKMSVIAKGAKVPIGTVYQFFPNKSAVIQTLAQAVMDNVRAQVSTQFAGVSSLPEAADQVESNVRGYHQFLKSNPTVRDILCSTQGDKKLQMLDQEDSRKNGEVLFGHLKHLVSASQHDQLAASCFLNMHLTGALVRLTVELEAQQAEALLQQFILGVRSQLMAFTPAAGR